MQLKRKYENQTRQTIVKCAARLFADNGFHGTGVREIVDKAGVALNSVNYYFGSKDNLFLETIKFVLKEKIQFDVLFLQEDEVIPEKPQALSNFVNEKIMGIFDIFYGTNRRYWYADLVLRAFQEEVPGSLEVAMTYISIVFDRFGEVYPIAKGKMDAVDYYSWMTRLWYSILGFATWRNTFGKELDFVGFAENADRDAYVVEYSKTITANAIKELGLPAAK
ncbi:MAG: TetR/AcrR family transcriptional regulator [Candidatus Cloacimonetes bacterium]|nr:TetR/AcrR family transcriptional regulator [Candidatus Cloacimonadota bacterium]